MGSLYITFEGRQTQKKTGPASTVPSTSEINPQGNRIPHSMPYRTVTHRINTPFTLPNMQKKLSIALVILKKAALSVILSTPYFSILFLCSNPNPIASLPELCAQRGHAERSSDLLSTRKNKSLLAIADPSNSACVGIIRA